MWLKAALTSQGRLNACHRQDFSHKNLYVDDLPHTLSRPSPKIGTEGQSALSLVRFELKEPSTEIKPGPNPNLRNHIFADPDGPQYGWDASSLTALTHPATAPTPDPEVPPECAPKPVTTESKILAAAFAHFAGDKKC